MGAERPGQDHRDGAHRPRGRRQPFNRRERASTPFPWLDHPPRGCRVPRSGARNRGTPTPLGVEFVRLQAILRPRIPPNRPQDAQNGRESGFPGSTGCGGSMTGMAATQSARDAAYARILKPSPGSRPGYRLAGSTRITSTGSSATTGLRSAVAPATGLGGWRTSPPAAPVAGRKRRGQRGRSPPPASLGDTRSVAPASMLACLRNAFGSPAPGQGNRKGLRTPPRACLCEGRPPGR